MNYGFQVVIPQRDDNFETHCTPPNMQKQLQTNLQPLIRHKEEGLIQMDEAFLSSQPGMFLRSGTLRQTRGSSV